MGWGECGEGQVQGEGGSVLHTHGVHRYAGPHQQRLQHMYEHIYLSYL
jgi:hypothetical protein